MGSKFYIDGINVAGKGTAVLYFHATLTKCFVDHRKEDTMYPLVSKAGSPIFAEVCAKRCVLWTFLEENSRNIHGGLFKNCHVTIACKAQGMTVRIPMTQG